MNETKSLKLDGPEKLDIHIVGIGGAGMSAIAHILLGLGHKVSGSDMAHSKVVDALVAAGATITIGHNESNVGAAQIITHSTAVDQKNPELRFALENQLSVLRRAQMLTAISQCWNSLLVAGTHGKTTTSAMLSVLLYELGLAPAFIVGGQIPALGGGASIGGGDYMVIEADESDGTFLDLASAGVVVTNIEPDHLEFYGTFERLEEAFVKFVSQTQGPAILCGDDPGCIRLISNLSQSQKQNLVTFGFENSNDWQIAQLRSSGRGQAFTVKNQNQEYGVNISQPGNHNALNALAASVLAISLGQDPTQVFHAIGSFDGVGRRYERRGSVDGIDFVDDYAHLPTEIEAALAAARSTEPARLVAVFQPHRFSRTEALWQTFGESFQDADLLVVTGIYSSGESPREGISGRLIADKVNEVDPDRQVIYIESLADVVDYLSTELRSGDLCMTLGAGDLTEIPDQVIEQLGKR